MPIIKLCKASFSEEATTMVMAAMGIASAMLYLAVALYMGLPPWAYPLSYLVFLGGSAAGFAVSVIVCNAEALLMLRPCELVESDRIPLSYGQATVLHVRDSGKTWWSRSAVYAGRDLLGRRVACMYMGYDRWLCFLIGQTRATLCLAREMRRSGIEIDTGGPLDSDHPWWRDILGALLAAQTINDL